VFAGSWCTESEDVEALALDADAELDRGDGPGLAQQSLVIRQLGRGVKLRSPQVASTVQLIG